MVTPPGDDSLPDERPVLRVIRGDATPEEIAALVTVLMAGAAGVAGPAEPTVPSRRSAWSDRSRLLHAPFHPAPGAWRSSALPG